FLFHHPPPTVIYPLSLHDALPISFIIEAEKDQLCRQPRVCRLAARGLRRRECGPRRLHQAKACAKVVSRKLTVAGAQDAEQVARDRKSTRLNSSHSQISYAVFCLK